MNFCQVNMKCKQKRKKIIVGGRTLIKSNVINFIEYSRLGLTRLGVDGHICLGPEAAIGSIGSASI